MRLVTGMEVEWVEGWVLPPEPGWTLPQGAQEHEITVRPTVVWGCPGVLSAISPPVRRGSCALSRVG